MSTATDETAPGTPLAKIVREALREELAEAEDRLMGRIAAAVVSAIGPRLNHLEVSQRVYEHRTRELERRMEVVEAELRAFREERDTLPPVPA